MRRCRSSVSTARRSYRWRRGRSWRRIIALWHYVCQLWVSGRKSWHPSGSRTPVPAWLTQFRRSASRKRLRFLVPTDRVALRAYWCSRSSALLASRLPSPAWEAICRGPCLAKASERTRCQSRDSRRQGRRSRSRDGGAKCSRRAAPGGKSGIGGMIWFVVHRKPTRQRWVADSLGDVDVSHARCADIVEQEPRPETMHPGMTAIAHGRMSRSPRRQHGGRRASAPIRPDPEIAAPRRVNIS